MSRFTIGKIIAPALILSSLTAVVSADELGRLFFSEKERQTLNQERSNPARVASRDADPKVQSDASANLEPSESVPLPPRTITGRVLRSSGNNTDWVNHFPQYKRGRQ